MLGALIIVFREVIEAGLIVGIVMAVTKGMARTRLVVALGVLAGLIGAALVAAFAGGLAQAFSGMGQEVFNASILIVAVVMLTWHNVWMAKHGRELAGEVKKVGLEVRSGARPIYALGVVCAVAVMREGSEVALFLYGLMASSGTTGWEMLVGSAFGLALGVAVTAVTYLGLLTIPPRYLFGVTTVLITLLAAGLAGQAVVFLQQAGVITVLADTAWDTSAILSDSSLPGRVLHTLVGYADQPSVLQVIVYFATLGAILSVSKVVAVADRRARRSAAARLEAAGAPFSRLREKGRG
jgi:high-affinity iron transporter